MSGHHAITILGNLGKNPELKDVGNGKQVCKLSVAVGTQNKRGEAKTTWYNVDCWNEMGERAAMYLEKGSKVLVTGTPSLVVWTGDDRVVRHRLEISATSLTFAGRPSGRPAPAPSLSMSPRVPSPESMPVPATFGGALAAIGAKVASKEAIDGDDYVGADDDEPDPIGHGMGFVDDDLPSF